MYVHAARYVCRLREIGNRCIYCGGVYARTVICNIQTLLLLRCPPEKHFVHDEIISYGILLVYIQRRSQLARKVSVMVLTRRMLCTVHYVFIQRGVSRHHTHKCVRGPVHPMSRPCVLRLIFEGGGRSSQHAHKLRVCWALYHGRLWRAMPLNRDPAPGEHVCQVGRGLRAAAEEPRQLLCF